MHTAILIFFFLSVVNTAVSGYTLEFTVSANSLPYTDLFGKQPPDPYCVILLRVGSSGYNSFGQTRVIDKTTSPYWSDRFTIGYGTGDDKEMKFDVYDSDPGIDTYLGGYRFIVKDLLEINGWQESSSYETTQRGLYDGTGNIAVKHRITSGRSARSGGDAAAECGNQTCPSSASHSVVTSSLLFMFWLACRFITCYGTK